MDDEKRFQEYVDGLIDVTDADDGDPLHEYREDDPLHGYRDADHFKQCDPTAYRMAMSEWLADNPAK